MNDLHQMASLSRSAARKLASTDTDTRNQTLLHMADLLALKKEKIFEANRSDLAEAKENGLAAPLYQRLIFDEAKLDQVVRGLVALAGLEDPIGKTTISRELTPGLDLYRVTCPIGVIGVIFESRPDALVQITSLALKSGNAVLLKGGREALRTNAALCGVLRQAAGEMGLDKNFAQLLETREDVRGMLQEDSLIDLIIPRGSKEFVRYIMNNTRIPVLGHADGLCHVYLDVAADPEKAVRVALDSKIQNVSVCNATETLLVHRNVVSTILPEVIRLYRENGVRVLADTALAKQFSCEEASEEDWSTEYLDKIISIRTVDSLDEAIDHINTYGSHHTDCIVTEDPAAASAFTQKVDSAGVYVNVSTRFADGFVYGFGAEVGIATGKIHARGPMGLEGLTTYKYKLIGNGHTLADMKSGKMRYTHKDLDQRCPL